MNRLGIAVRDLGATELNWRLIKQANAMRNWDITFFIEESLPPCVNLNAAVMRLSEMWGYSGPIVATTLSTAKRLAICPSPSAKLLYAWDLEWLRMYPRPFKALHSAYNDSKLRIVARTDEHARLFDKLWGAKVVATNFNANLQELAETAR